jgi:hypothetical protein
MPVTRDASTCALPTISTKNVKAFVALRRLNDRTAPAAFTYTLTAAAAKSAVALAGTVVFAGGATSTNLSARQPLQWRDPVTGDIGIVFASADYTSGAAISISPAEEAIPSGAIIQFPVPLELRTDLQTATSTNAIELDSLDHKIAGAEPGTTTVTLTAPGYKNHYNAGQQTCRIANDGGACGVVVGKEVWIEIVDPVPGRNGANWTKGDAESGVFFITGINKGNANNAGRTYDITGRFVTYAETLAVAA